MYALLDFIMATLEISFDLRGLFGGCILKNPPVWKYWY